MTLFGSSLHLLFKKVQRITWVLRSRLAARLLRVPTTGLPFCQCLLLAGVGLGQGHAATVIVS